MTPEAPAHPFRLGHWLVDPAAGEITGESEIRRLEPRVMDLLVRLASQPGRVVGRSELLESVWKGAFVTDDVVRRAVSSLRRELGDDAANPSFIETIPRRGYRLVASVRPVTNAPPFANESPKKGQKTSRPAEPKAPAGRAAMAAALTATCIALALLAWRLVDSPPLGKPEEASFETVVRNATRTRVTTHRGWDFDPDYSPGNDRIVLVRSAPDGQVDLFVVLVDGAAPPLRLTSDPAVESSPRWSPDGQRIAFVRPARGVFVVPALGGEPIRLADRTVGQWGLSLAWRSNDCVAYPWRPDPSVAFHLVESCFESGSNRTLSHPPSDQAGDVAVATHLPSGRTAVIRRISPNRHRIGFLEPETEEPTFVIEREGHPFRPTWWADGKVLLWAEWGNGLWWMNREDPRPRPLEKGSDFVGDPVFSSDGRFLAWVTLKSDVNLERWNPERKNWDHLADSTAFDGSACGFDDGVLVFVSTRSNEKRLWTATDESGPASPLSRGFGSDLDPANPQRSASLRDLACSPHRRRVAYVVEPVDGAPYLAELDMETSREERLFESKGHYLRFPSYAADGRSLLISRSADAEDWRAWSVPLDGGVPEPIGDQSIERVIESRDGRWRYFSAPFDARIWRQALAGGAAEVVWDSRDRWPTWTYTQARPWDLTPDGQLLVLDWASGEGGTVKRVDPDREVVVETIPLPWHPMAVRQARWITNGGLIVEMDQLAETEVEAIDLWGSATRLSTESL